jgi:hypothetical protein
VLRPDKKEDLNDYKFPSLYSLDFNLMNGNSLNGYVSNDTLRSHISINLYKKLCDDLILRESLIVQYNLDNQDILIKNQIVSMDKKWNKELNEIYYPNYDLDELKDLQETSLSDYQKSLPFHWIYSFNSIFRYGGFDLIIGNPPYLMENKYRDKFIGTQNTPYYCGKNNLAHIFSCISVDLLKNDGITAYITENKWFFNAGAKKMRWKISQETIILEIIDFMNCMVFPDSSVQTMIYFVQKSNLENYYLVAVRKLKNKIRRISLESDTDFDDKLTESDIYEIFSSQMPNTPYLDIIKTDKYSKYYSQFDPSSYLKELTEELEDDEVAEEELDENN